MAGIVEAWQSASLATGRQPHKNENHPLPESHHGQGMIAPRRRTCQSTTSRCLTRICGLSLVFVPEWMQGQKGRE